MPSRPFASAVVVASVLLGCAGAASHPTAAAAASVLPAASRTIPGAQHVTFASRDAELTGGRATQLDGWLFRPQGAGPFPAVIAFHGCTGLYRRGGDLSARHRDWAERLAGEGYVVLLPDSFSARGVEEICSSEHRTIRPAFERNRDAYGALEYLEAQPFVRADRVALLGWSNGAMTVLSAIAASTRARPETLPHMPVTAVAFYPGCGATLSHPRWLPPAVPLHMLVGALDDWTPAASCIELSHRAEAAGAPFELVVYPGAYHGFDDPVTRVHVRDRVANTASGTATVGQNPAARADSIARVLAIFRTAIGS